MVVAFDHVSPCSWPLPSTPALTNSTLAAPFHPSLSPDLSPHAGIFVQCNSAVCAQMLRWLKGVVEEGVEGEEAEEEGLIPGGRQGGRQGRRQRRRQRGRLLLEPYCGALVAVVVVAVA